MRTLSKVKHAISLSTSSLRAPQNRSVFLMNTVPARFMVDVKLFCLSPGRNNRLKRNFDLMKLSVPHIFAAHTESSCLSIFVAILYISSE